MLMKISSDAPFEKYTLSGYTLVKRHLDLFTFANLVFVPTNAFKLAYVV